MDWLCENVTFFEFHLKCNVSLYLPLTLSSSVRISKPEISISVFKDGGNYRGNVTCWSSTGSPPVNFTLLLDDNEVGSVTAAESLSAWFDVPVVIGLNMGEARCRGRTAVQDLKSEALTLEVGEISVQDARHPVMHTLVSVSELIAFLSPSSSACSPGWRGCKSGSGLPVHCWGQTGRCQAELSHQQRDVPTLLLALQRLYSPAWVRRGVPISNYTPQTSPYPH